MMPKSGNKRRHGYLTRWLWGFCLSSMAAGLVSLLSGLGMGSLIWGLICIAVLYGVLQIGDESKSWPQLD